MSEYKPDYDPVIDADTNILSIAFNDYDAYCESTEASAVFNWLYEYALGADKRIAELESSVIKAVDQEEIDSDRIEALQDALKESNVLIDDQGRLLSPELYGKNYVEETMERVKSKGGSLAYGADVLQKNRALLSQGDQE